MNTLESDYRGESATFVADAGVAAIVYIVGEEALVASNPDEVEPEPKPSEPEPSEYERKRLQSTSFRRRNLAPVANFH